MLKTTEVIKSDEKMVISGKNEIIPEDWKKIAYNVLKWTLPIMGITFFSSLQMGASLEDAFKLSLAALYGPIVDILTKWKNEVRYVVDK